MEHSQKKISLFFRWLLMMSCLLLLGTTMTTTTEASFADKVNSMAEIQNVRVSTSADKARIVIDCGKEVDYKVSVLSNPQRIVVDISNAWLNSSVKKSFSLDSRFATSLRIAQHDTSTVRVVVESTMGKNNYKVFPLKGGTAGYRLVLDFGNLGSGTQSSEINFNPQPKTDTAEDETDTGKDTDEAKDEQEVKSVTEPVFTPGLKGKIIALDAGHGGSDVGAIGPTGVTEKSVTLRVAKALQEKLEDAGATVLMTRTTDTEVSPKKFNASDVEELQARCDVGNDGDADVFLSLHMDSFTNSTPAGTTGYYYVQGTKAGQRLAKSVSEALVKSIGTGNRGTKSCNFYVVKHTVMPAALIEMAFISNDKEEKLMNSDAGVKKAAEGIFQGLKNFFG